MKISRAHDYTGMRCSLIFDEPCPGKRPSTVEEGCPNHQEITITTSIGEQELWIGCAISMQADLQGGYTTAILGAADANQESRNEIAVFSNNVKDGMRRIAEVMESLPEKLPALLGKGD